MSKRESIGKIAGAAKILGLSAVIDASPGQLSGGQRQRVAMGRAIVREPAVFLMDEPLSNLDAKLRVEMRAEILRIQRRVNVATVYVTHDQTEAMTMGDRVAVLEAGLCSSAPRRRRSTTSRQTWSSPRSSGPRPMNLFEASCRLAASVTRCWMGASGCCRVGAIAPERPIPALRRATSAPRSSIDAVPRRSGPSPTPEPTQHRRARGEVELVEALGSEVLVPAPFSELSKDSGRRRSCRRGRATTARGESDTRRQASGAPRARVRRPIRGSAVSLPRPDPDHLLLRPQAHRGGDPLTEPAARALTAVEASVTKAHVLLSTGEEQDGVQRRLDPRAQSRASPTASPELPLLGRSPARGPRRARAVSARTAVTTVRCAHGSSAPCTPQARPRAAIVALNDAELLLPSVRAAAGVGLIAGTARWRSATTERASCNTVIAGGWVKSIGDEGSATGLFRDIARKVAEAYDRGEPEDPVVAPLLESIGIDHVRELPAALARFGWPTAWARLAPDLFDRGLSAGSTLTGEALEENAAALAGLVASLRGRGAATDTVVAAGGVIANAAWLQDAVARALQRTSPASELVVLGSRRWSARPSSPAISRTWLPRAHAGPSEHRPGARAPLRARPAGRARLSLSSPRPERSNREEDPPTARPSQCSPTCSRQTRGQLVDAATQIARTRSRRRGRGAGSGSAPATTPRSPPSASSGARGYAFAVDAGEL